MKKIKFIWMLFLFVSVTSVFAQNYNSTHTGGKIDTVITKADAAISGAGAWTGLPVDTNKTTAKVTTFNGRKGNISLITSDILGLAQTDTFTAGESLAAGDICYLKSDGKFWKGDSDAEATTKGMIAMAAASISTNASGTFILSGRIASAGLTAGDVLYLSGTPGGITATAPTAAGKFVRVVGYALTDSIFYFSPSPIYLEL